MILEKIKIWTLATRAETLIISICPITIGCFLASKDTSLSMPILIITYLYGISLHLATNLSNDYFDYIKGADTEDRIAPFSTIQLNLTSLNQIKYAYSFFFILGLIIGVILIFRGGFVACMLFTLPILSGFFYTAGNKPLGYLGFGEFLVFIFFGPFAVLGTYFLQTLTISYLPFLAGTAYGCFAVIVICINNLRDQELDRKANKKTLAVRYGEKFVQMEILLSAILIFIIPWIFYLSLKNLFILIPSFLIFLIPYKIIFKPKNLSLLNNAIQKTVFVQIAYTVLFCIGLIRT